MTDRNIQFFGHGFNNNPSETPASITATVDGVEVFSGAITTAELPVPALPAWATPDQTVSLFEITVPIEFTGTKSVSIQLNSGSAIFSYDKAQYSLMRNPIYTNEQMAILTNPSSPVSETSAIYHSTGATFTPEQVAILNDPSATTDEKQAIYRSLGIAAFLYSGTQYAMLEGASRSNIVINGVPQEVPVGSVATWWWTVGYGGTFSFDLTVPPALV